MQNDLFSDPFTLKNVGGGRVIAREFPPELTEENVLIFILLNFSLPKLAHSAFWPLLVIHRVICLH